MDARTATSKAETTFHTGDVAADENAHRGQLADREWRVDDKEPFQRSGEGPLISFMLHRMSFGTKRTCRSHSAMSAIGDKGDIASGGLDIRC